MKNKSYPRPNAMPVGFDPSRNQGRNFKKERLSKRIVLSSSLLFLSLLMFELFSFSSSYEALMGILGIQRWAFWLAFAVCAVDFAGLAELFMPELRRLDDLPKQFLAGAWVLSAVFDTWLTWLVIQSHTKTLVGHIMVTSGILKPEFFSFWVPLVIAAFSWGIQVLLVTRLGVAADKLSNRKGE